MKHLHRVSLAALLLGSLLTGGSVAVTATAAPGDLPTCQDFATDPELGLAQNPEVSDISVTLFDNTSPRCEVEFIYSTRGGPEYGYEVGEQQRIGIRVGLPLNSVDGGGGGIEGAWNGRTRNLGGGGSAGELRPVTSATDAGYVGSNTDAGHDGSAGGMFPLELDPNRLNTGRLEDFIVNGVAAQVEWATTLSETYYGRAPIGRYWDGCSTGGRQGLAIAQEHPELLDGWLVEAPAVNYGRFRLGQLWGQLAMKDLVGAPIPRCKLDLAVQSAIEACDADDGVVDGIINEPRSCDYDASDLVGIETPCGVVTAPEVAAIVATWDGPKNAFGKRIFPGWSRGTALNGVNGANPRSTATDQVRWNFEDASFDWRTLTMEDYPAVAELGSRTHGDIINTDDVDLEEIRDNGKKILMWHGAADGAIQVDNSLEYYTSVAAHFGKGKPDFDGLQSWFRYFRAPGVGHCGGGVGPQPVDPFEAMVDWVENGVAPDELAAQNTSGGEVTRSRILCPFPQEALYDGAGDPDVAASWSCGGDVQTLSNICLGLLTPYKHESVNRYEVRGSGYNASACARSERGR